jgi:hypothetical protein
MRLLAACFVRLRCCAQYFLTLRSVKHVDDSCFFAFVCGVALRFAEHVERYAFYLDAEIIG